MAEQEKPASKPASVKKSVAKKSATRQASAKKAAPKKAAAKKSPAKKAASTQGANAKKTQVASKKASVSADPMLALTSIIDEMRRENANRDRQMSELVKQIGDGFGRISQQTSAKVDSQHQEMNRLHESLQSAFSNAEDSNKQSEERSLLILKALSESIMQDHEQTLKEVQEEKKLQDRKIEHLTKLEEQRSRKSRWIAIPGTIIAIIAIIYMFYVVSVMETAMTSMSGDMGEMKVSVSNMSARMNGMAEDTRVMQGGVKDMTTLMGNMAANTSTMSADMNQLNTNLTHMGYNLGVLTRQVSPTMKGMRDMMPWAD